MDIVKIGEIIESYFDLVARARKIAASHPHNVKLESDTPCELELWDDGDATLTYPIVGDDYDGPGYITTEFINFDAGLLCVSAEDFLQWRKDREIEKKAHDEARYADWNKRQAEADRVTYERLKAQFEK